jgi:hypothetical protein
MPDLRAFRLFFPENKLRCQTLNFFSKLSTFFYEAFMHFILDLSRPRIITEGNAGKVSSCWRAGEKIKAIFAKLPLPKVLLRFNSFSNKSSPVT